MTSVICLVDEAVHLSMCRHMCAGCGVCDQGAGGDGEAVAAEGL